MVKKLCLLMLIFVLFSSNVFAQSIADAARKERERRERIREDKKEESKKANASGKVITERDLKAVGGNVTSSKVTTKQTKEDIVSTAKPKDIATDSKGNSEAYWRSKKQQLEQELADAEKKYKDLDEFLSKNHTRFTLQSLAPIKNDRDKLAEKVAQIKQKMEDLKEEARKAGALPEWLR